MDYREGVLWGYRLLLNREPESEAVIAGVAGSVNGPDDIRAGIARSDEFRSILDRAGLLFEPRFPVDWREGIRWAYRLLLRREPSEEEVHHHLVEDNVAALRTRFVLSREFESSGAELRELADFAVVNAFAPFPAKTPIEDAFQDFLGSIVKVRYLDRGWHDRMGQIQQSIPRASEPSLHGTSEWVGTLRSVLEAKDTFTSVELGAGWAPWLIVSARAARHRGIERLDLIGVEGSAEHHGFMLDNFRVNGLNPGDYALHHAVVGATDGVASFPRLHVASDDYGANAVFDEQEREGAAARGDLEEVKCVSLSTLLKDKGRVDLIHIDIQGHEETVLRAGMEVLNEKVRRLVIGTHSRTIEGHLLDLLHQNGWICESEVPCKLRRVSSGELVLVVDGEQVWRNDRV